jgi:mRNA interferase MazF
MAKEQSRQWRGKKMTNISGQNSVFWFDPEPVQGSELRKVRPCIIVSSDEMNENLRTVIVVPLTTTDKAWPFRLAVNVLNRKSYAACEQLRVIDKTRLKARIGNLRPADSKALSRLLQSMFA